jgi:hypothetical protein
VNKCIVTLQNLVLDFATETIRRWGATTFAWRSRAPTVCGHLDNWSSESWSIEDMRCSVIVLFAVGTGLATVRFPMQGVQGNDNEKDLETRKTDGCWPHGLVSTSDWRDII